MSRQTGSHDSLSRVFHLPLSLPDAIKSRRTSLCLTMRDFVAQTITQQLPELERALSQFLPGAHGERRRPVRLPLTEALLKELHRVSTQADVSIARLMLACLLRSVSRPDRPRPKKKK